MFITKQQRPCIEFNPEDGQQAPTLVHCFSEAAPGGAVIQGTEEGRAQLPGNWSG